MKIVYRTLVFSILFSILVFFTSRYASAQSSDSSDYLRTISEAISEYNSGHFEEARRLFEAAHLNNPNARTLRGIGLVAFKARDYVTTVEVLEAALKDERKPLTEKMRTQANDILQKAKLFIARYTLEVEPDEEPLTITVDGNPATSSDDKKLSLNPGDHELVVTAPGYKTERRTIRVVSGKDVELNIRLISVQESNLESSDTNQEYSELDQRTDAKATGDNSVYRTLGWIAVAGSALALGGGITASVIRESKAGEWIDNACTEDDLTGVPCGGLYDDVVEAEIGMAVCFSVAGAFAAASVVFFILNANNTDDDSNNNTTAFCTIRGLGPGMSCGIKF